MLINTRESSMTNRLGVFAAILSLLASLGGVSLPDRQVDRQVDIAYVEPGLLSSSGTLALVVMGERDSREAARAVERAGGEVRADLWLARAVAATLPSDRLPALAAMP